MEQNISTSSFMGTGRRKNAVARVRVMEGSGKVLVNGKTVEEFFGGLLRHKRTAFKPVEISAPAKGYDFIVYVNGGGVTGQAGAISQGISRALLKIDPALKQNLRKEGLLTRDSRMVERKKPGRPKARKRFQFSKR
jgi:small subunit ribosomal protein S9